MKKILIIISLIFLITGCSNINDLTYDEIIQNFGTISSRTNTYRTGYKYYLPRGMQVNDSTLFNEILEDGKNTYYLYVDAVSYLNQVDYKYEENSENDFFNINESNQDKILYQILSLCKERLKNYGDYEFFKSIQVLTPTKKGKLGTRELNKCLQAELNPKVEGIEEKTYGDVIFREGDRVMQIKNNYDIYWEKGSRDNLKTYEAGTRSI